MGTCIRSRTAAKLPFYTLTSKIGRGERTRTSSDLNLLFPKQVGYHLPIYTPSQQINRGTGLNVLNFSHLAPMPSSAGRLPLEGVHAPAHGRRARSKHRWYLGCHKNPYGRGAVS